MAASAPTTFRLAHLSDVHVFASGALWTSSLWELKRLLGALNVALRRGPRAYDADVLADALGTVHADHVAITGDITNLATRAEFARAARIVFARWGACERASGRGRARARARVHACAAPLAAAADVHTHSHASPRVDPPCACVRTCATGPEDVSTVPGNHDIYTRSSDRDRFYAHVRTAGACARGGPVTPLTRPPSRRCPRRCCRHQHFGATTTSDVPVAGAVDGFPYVRWRWDRRIALIGLNSARWQPPFVAGGELGAAHLDRCGARTRSTLALGALRAPAPGARRPARRGAYPHRCTQPGQPARVAEHPGDAVQGAHAAPSASGTLQPAGLAALLAQGPVRRWRTPTDAGCDPPHA